VIGLAWSLAGLATLFALVFAALWLRSARSARQSQKLLLAAEQKLEQVQRQFQRFVPEDVVERLTDSADILVPERPPRDDAVRRPARLHRAVRPARPGRDGEDP
jgi:adenylate cyclase